MAHMRAVSLGKAATSGEAGDPARPVGTSEALGVSASRAGRWWVQAGQARRAGHGKEEHGRAGTAHSTLRLRTSCAAVRVRVVAQAWGSAMRALACTPARSAEQG